MYAAGVQKPAIAYQGGHTSTGAWLVCRPLQVTHIATPTPTPGAQGAPALDEHHARAHTAAAQGPTVSQPHNLVLLILFHVASGVYIKSVCCYIITRCMYYNSVYVQLGNYSQHNVQPSSTLPPVHLCINKRVPMWPHKTPRLFMGVCCPPAAVPGWCKLEHAWVFKQCRVEATLCISWLRGLLLADAAFHTPVICV